MGEQVDEEQVFIVYSGSKCSLSWSLHNFGFQAAIADAFLSCFCCVEARKRNPGICDRTVFLKQCQENTRKHRAVKRMCQARLGIGGNAIILGDEKAMRGLSNPGQTLHSFFTLG